MWVKQCVFKKLKTSKVVLRTSFYVSLHKIQGIHIYSVVALSGMLLIIVVLSGTLLIF